jgi:hypothetical protein
MLTSGISNQEDDMKLDNKKIVSVYLSVWDFEYTNPYAEQPSDNIATNYYVTVADKQGNTWVHDWGLQSNKVNHDEARERVERMVERIENHLDAGGALDPKHWDDGHPQYGSVAWQRFDLEEIQPAAAMLANGYHPDDLPASVQGYF